MDQAGEPKVARHFVNDPRGIGCAGFDAADVTRPDLAKAIPRQKARCLRIVIAETRYRLFEVVELARAENLWMAREDLLDQCAARARHAEDEHRDGRGVTDTLGVAHDLGSVRSPNVFEMSQ